MTNEEQLRHDLETQEIIEEQERWLEQCHEHLIGAN